MLPYKARLQELRQQMDEAAVDLLVLTPSPAMYWLTGIRERPYFGSLKGPGDWLSSVLVGAEKGPLLFVQWMVHRMLARLPAPFDGNVEEVRIVQHEDDADKLLRDALSEFGPLVRRIAVSEQMHARYLTALMAACPEAEIVMASPLVEGLMAIKDEMALAHMRRIIAITDAAYGEAIKSLRPGVTEKEVALEIDYQFRLHGAEGSAFPSSVVFGRPGDVPPPPGKTLQPGDSVMFDIGATLDGYCADFGRSAFVGDPTPAYLALHDLVLRAQKAGAEAMRAGEVQCHEIVTAVQNVLIEGGVGQNLIPQVGHAIGIALHEAPLLIKGDTTVIQAGMLFTIEPTIRHPNGYVNRVEDIVVVTQSGVEFLSSYPQTLHII